MKIGNLIQKWSGINVSSKIVIVTDAFQRGFADSVKREGLYDVEVVLFPMADAAIDLLKSLSDSDLVMVMLSFDSFVKFGGGKCFSPFSKPDWISAKYIFMRLEISQKSLLQGLLTEKALVYDKIEEMNNINTDEIVKITNAGGTDISFKIKPFTTCQHEITEEGGMAFLPPSEVSAGVIGVDESIIDSCHFGFGDGSTCGTHWDVVITEPVYEFER